MSRNYHDDSRQDIVSGDFGGGFIPIDDLVENVEAWRQRKTLCEDVDLLEQKGGMNYFYRGLKTDPVRGINSSSIPDRIAVYGTNEIPSDPPATFCELFFEALQDMTLIILMVAAVASIVVNMIMEAEHRSTAWIEGFAILMAVFVSSFVQALNNYQKEKEFQKLNAEAESLKSIKIIRDGQEQEHKLTECLVGDLVVIAGGDELAADGIVVQAYSVGCDESAMTGETELMEKAALGVIFMLGEVSFDSLLSSN